MSLRALWLLAGIFTLAFSTSATIGASSKEDPPQTKAEEIPPADSSPQDKAAPADDEDEEEAKKKKATEKLLDRLTVRAGTAAFSLRGRSRGTTQFFDNFDRGANARPRFFNINNNNDIRFGNASSVALTADASFRITPRITATLEYLTAAPEEGETFDNRRIANLTGPGDVTLAEFQSTAEADYSEWSMGGQFRFFPTKKKGAGSRFQLHGLVNYQRSNADYRYAAGDLTGNPFRPFALSDPNFTAAAGAAASYAFDFENLAVGARFSGLLSKRLNLDVTVAPVVFSRFEGEADLGPHGLVFVHNALHMDPNFDQRSCVQDDADPNTPLCIKPKQVRSRPPCVLNDQDPNTPECGLVEADLSTNRGRVEQQASRGRALNLDLNVDYKFTNWFGIAVGMKRHDVRSLGGTEKRLFGVDSADCSKDNLKNEVECGDLVQSKIIAQSFFIMGRFRWF